MTMKVSISGGLDEKVEPPFMILKIRTLIIQFVAFLILFSMFRIGRGEKDRWILGSCLTKFLNHAFCRFPADRRRVLPVTNCSRNNGTDI